MDNISFFAFTATPKGKTLEMFGTENELGEYHPFHLYSMKQAIEEGFILDVLKYYLTYPTYFKLVKTIEDDPEFEEKKAKRVLTEICGRTSSCHPYENRNHGRSLHELYLKQDPWPSQGNGSHQIKITRCFI